MGLIRWIFLIRILLTYTYSNSQTVGWGFVRWHGVSANCYQMFTYIYQRHECHNNLEVLISCELWTVLFLWWNNCTAYIPKDGNASRPIIAKFHYFQEEVDVLWKAMGAGPVSAMANVFLIQKKRSEVAFTEVRRLLHWCPDMKRGLLYPATLKITTTAGIFWRFDQGEALRWGQSASTGDRRRVRVKQRGYSAHSKLLLVNTLTLQLDLCLDIFFILLFKLI